MSTLDNYADMRQQLQRDGYVQAYTRNARPVFVGPKGDHVWLKWMGPGLFEREQVVPSPAWKKRLQTRVKEPQKESQNP